MLAIAQGNLTTKHASASLTVTFQQLYETHFDFVWRSIRRLGVHPPATDDLVQEVFVVVHRRLDDFEGRSSHRTWLFAIARRVVSDHQRRLRRKPEASLDTAPSPVDPQQSPDSVVAARQAAVLLERFLDSLPAPQREAFVALELEQMNAPELAEATGVSVNTIYSRLRLARAAFERTVRRLHAGEGTP